MSDNPKLGKLRQKLDDEEIDAILVSAPENRRYLSGFTGSSGYLLVSRSHAVLATDFRYVEQAGSQAPDFAVERISGGAGWFPQLAAEMGVRRVGFEETHMTVAAHAALRRAVESSESGNGPELVPTSEIIDRLRAVKDDGELALLSRAVEIADEALDEVAPAIEPGVSEEGVAWELEKAMRERGADEMAFDIIVGSGPNGALPHHRAGDRVIERGDAVVIDMGARYRGYCSDLTRTVIVGEPDDTFRAVYATVLDAQLAAEERAAAGMSGGEVDAVSRGLISDAGYGDKFGHSLGHGVGLAVHEFPRVGPNSDDALEDGMVFTVEPGIYLPGWGGVRIEDMVVMEGGRARVLSKARKLALS